MKLAPLPHVLGVVLCLPFCRLAEAAPSGPLVDKLAATPADRKIIDEAVQPGFAQGAFGASPWTAGALATSQARGDFENSSNAWLGGGLRAWVSPIGRLTLFGEVARRDNDEFAPSAGAQVRLLGASEKGYALGISGRCKAEGFAELGGEVELGLLGSLHRHRVRLDLNLIAGTAFEEEESDGEILTRACYEALSFLCAGVEGRGRYRLRGDVALPGGRAWDAVLGAELFASYKQFFGLLMAGPSTVGTPQDVGWLAMLSVGGASY